MWLLVPGVDLSIAETADSLGFSLATISRVISSSLLNLNYCDVTYWVVDLFHKLWRVREGFEYEIETLQASKGHRPLLGLPAVSALPDFPPRASLLWICPQWFSNSLVFWSRCRHTIPNPYPWREVVQISMASGRRWPHMQTPHRQASSRWWIWTQENLVLRQKC